jgi:hypothetical protein
MNALMKRLLPELVLIIAVAAFVYSLFLPGIVVGDRGQTTVTIGYFVLSIGWLGIFDGIVSWYGNPIALAAIILANTKNKTIGSIFSTVAVVFGLQALLYQGTKISYGDSDGPFGILGVGYYIWEASLALILLYTLVKYFQNKNVSSR